MIKIFKNPMNNEQRLGFRTFLFYTFQHIFLAVITLAGAIGVTLLPQTGILDNATVSFNITPETLTSVLWFLFLALICATVLIIILGTSIAYLQYMSLSFLIDEFGLKIRKGFFSKYELTIPFRHIENVNIDQSILFRMLGLAKVTILTAGNDSDDRTGESEGEIKIIDAPLAYSLRKTLLEKSKQEER